MMLITGARQVASCRSAALVLLGCAALLGCARTPLPAAAPENRVATLTATDLKMGSGATAVPGSKVTVHYTGWLYDSKSADQKGTEFDSSRKQGDPFSFVLGQRQVIAGWDQGVAGMQVGGQRRLVIPGDLAYGDSGAGGVIPPGATLVFDFELLDVQAP